MLNLGSLILGIGAWLFAALAIIKPSAGLSHRNTVVSFSLCAVSLLLQVIEINRRVLLGDYAAIADTVRAVLIAAVSLICVTIILNVIAACKVKNK